MNALSKVVLLILNAPGLWMPAIWIQLWPSAQDYFAKLTRLEQMVTCYEEPIFELLQNQSHQNMADLASRLTGS